MANYKIDIKGVICPNSYAWWYDWIGEDYTCPSAVSSVLDVASELDNVDVYINSGGGEIASGSDIYTALKSSKANVNIHITGQACSAASVIAMAGHSEMSPTALMMVHCVSTCAQGNHSDMEKTAAVLATADNALASAYALKAGMSLDEALEMMEAETWLTASRAKELGLIDAIMFEEAETDALVAANGFRLPSEAQMNQARAMIEAQKEENRLKEERLASVRAAALNLLEGDTQ